MDGIFTSLVCCDAVSLARADQVVIVAGFYSTLIFYELFFKSSPGDWIYMCGNEIYSQDINLLVN